MKKWLPVILSVILPGTGQFVQRHWAKGAGFLLAAMLFSGMLRRRTILASEFSDWSMAHLLLLAVLLGLAAWSAFDAFRSGPHAPSHS